MEYPVDVGELKARIRAIVRRGPIQVRSEIAIGDLIIDTREQRVYKSSRAVPLTVKEYAILEYLARHAGTLMSRAALSTTFGTTITTQRLTLSKFT